MTDLDALQLHFLLMRQRLKATLIIAKPRTARASRFSNHVPATMCFGWFTKRHDLARGTGFALTQQPLDIFIVCIFSQVQPQKTFTKLPGN